MILKSGCGTSPQLQGERKAGDCFGAGMNGSFSNLRRENEFLWFPEIDFPASNFPSPLGLAGEQQASTRRADNAPAGDRLPVCRTRLKASFPGLKAQSGEGRDEVKGK